MTRACVGIGSNLGDRLAALATALDALEAVPGIGVVAVSRVYESEPWGVTSQPAFANAVALLDADLTARELLAVCKRIESDAGRVAGIRNGPRALDLDILLFGSETIDGPALTIPHPRLMERDFVVTPLLEVMPEAALPDGTRVTREAASAGRVTGVLAEIVRASSEPEGAARHRFFALPGTAPGARMAGEGHPLDAILRAIPHDERSRGIRPMQCTKCGADLQPGATVCQACGERVVPTGRPLTPQPAGTVVTPAPRSRPSDRPVWYVPALIAVALTVVAITGWVVYSVIGGGSNTPEGVAMRMMQAYAAYDARGILDNATHASLTATDEVTFEKQAADRKATDKLPALKDIKVTKVTIDPKNPDEATVQLTEMILDPVKGTYSPRNETLSLVKQKDGKWLVRLF